MGSWCCDNLRDCSGWMESGLKLSTTSNDAAKLYDATLRQLVSWIDCEQLGGIITTTKLMLEADPNSIMSRSLVFGMDALSSDRKLDAEFESQLNSLVKDAEKNGNEREKKHAKAVCYYANGEMTKACDEWETILAQYPTDLQAIKFVHDAYFFSGKNKEKLISIENVINKWSPTLPCYSYLHGMHAFALEEMENYIEAEKAAQTALNLQKQDAWATHAFSHCKEMQGQYGEGIKFMESTLVVLIFSNSENWEPCWMISCHNYWHLALFYLEKADYETTLQIYDNEIAKKSKIMLDLVDSASLLMRLQMEGVNVGKRFANLIPLAEKHIESHVLSFNDAHIAMALANAEEAGLQKKHFDSIENFIGSAPKTNENRKITELYGQSICEAISAYKKDDYTGCFEKLYPIRHDIYKIGGSNAQRDVFTQLIVNSGFKSDNSEQKNNALKVLEERKSKKHSLVSDRILSRHQQETSF